MEEIQLRQVSLLDYPEYSLLFLLPFSSWSAKVENKHVRQKDKEIQLLVSKYLRRRFTLSFLGFGSGMGSVSSLISDIKGKFV